MNSGQKLLLGLDQNLLTLYDIKGKACRVSSGWFKGLLDHSEEGVCNKSIGVHGSRYTPVILTNQSRIRQNYARSYPSTNIRRWRVLFRPSLIRYPIWISKFMNQERRRLGVARIKFCSDCAGVLTLFCLAD